MDFGYDEYEQEEYLEQISQIQGDLDNTQRVIEKSMMKHKRQESQFGEMAYQFKLTYNLNDEEAENMAINTMDMLDADPYSLFKTSTVMTKVLQKLYNDEKEREANLETLYLNDKVNVDQTLCDAYLKHKRKESTFDSIRKDFKLVFDDEEKASQYAKDLMEQMEMNPFDLFEDDDKFETVIHKKNMDEIILEKIHELLFIRMKNGLQESPNAFQKHEVGDIVKAVIIEVFQNQNMTNKDSIFMRRMQHEVVETNRADVANLRKLIENVDAELAELRDQIVQIGNEKCQNALFLNQNIDQMRDMILKYTSHAKLVNAQQKNI